MHHACKTILHEKAVTIDGLHAYLGFADDGLPIITDLCLIEWRAEIDTVPTGIEEIVVVINRVQLTCTLTSTEELSGQTQGESFTLDTTEPDFGGFTVIAEEVQTDTAGTLKITCATFDFESKTIFLS